MSVFDHFVGLALKELKSWSKIVETYKVETYEKPWKFSVLTFIYLGSPIIQKKILKALERHLLKNYQIDN